jgi:hypothetical protein
MPSSSTLEGALYPESGWKTCSESRHPLRFLFYDFRKRRHVIKKGDKIALTFLFHCIKIQALFNPKTFLSLYYPREFKIYKKYKNSSSTQT